MRIYFVASEQSDHQVFAEALQDHELHFVSELKDVEINSVEAVKRINQTTLENHQRFLSWSAGKRGRQNDCGGKPLPMIRPLLL